MANVNLDTFYDYILTEIPGVGVPQLKQELRNAIIDFCKDTKTYTETLSAINVVSGTSTYTLTVTETTARVVDIVDVKHNDKGLSASNTQELDSLYTDWDAGGTGVPSYYLSVVDRATVRLVKTPGTSITAGLVVKVALSPTRAATTVPDWILERWVDAIKFRTLARMYLQMKKPWSDPQLSRVMNQYYQTAAGIGDREKSQDFTRKRMRVRAYYR